MLLGMRTPRNKPRRSRTTTRPVGGFYGGEELPEHSGEEEFAATDSYEDNYYYDYDQGHDDEPVVNFSSIAASKPHAVCKRCKRGFPSNNQLHKRLRVDHCQKGKSLESATAPTLAPAVVANHINVIESKVNSKLDTRTGYDFRNWHYVTVGVKFSLEARLEQVCLDNSERLSKQTRELMVANNTLLESVDAKDREIEEQTSYIYALEAQMEEMQVQDSSLNQDSQDVLESLG